ncbi:MAG: polysaccharide deacetylase family protein [Sciscionella sp.]
MSEYDEDPYLVTVSPQRFEDQSRWIQRCGFRDVSMAELLAARSNRRARGLVGPTFDDGYADFTANVVSSLRRYDFTVTVFVITGALSGSNYWDPRGRANR